MVQTADSTSTVLPHATNINVANAANGTNNGNGNLLTLNGSMKESSNRLSSPEDTKKRIISKTEKILSASLIFTVSLIILLISLILLIVLRDKCWSSANSHNPFSSLYDHSPSASSGQNSWSTPLEACLSPVCVTSAAEIMKRIDLSVDPCVDFYKYSCGGMDNKLNPIPDDKSSVSTSSLLQLEIDKKIRGKNLCHSQFSSPFSHSDLLFHLYFVTCVLFLPLFYSIDPSECTCTTCETFFL